MTSGYDIFRTLDNNLEEQKHFHCDTLSYFSRNDEDCKSRLNSLKTVLWCKELFSYHVM